MSPVEMKNSPFFEGIEETEEEKVLKGLDAHEMTYDKENYILHCGERERNGTAGFWRTFDCAGGFLGKTESGRVQ